MIRALPYTRIWFLFIFMNGCWACFAQPNSIEAVTDSTEMELGRADVNESKDFVGQIDKTIITKKKFNASTLQRLKDDPDFNYKQPPTVAETLWDRFWQWVKELVGRLLQGATTTSMGQFLMYVLGIILLSVLIMMLLKVNAFRVFYSGADRGNISNGLFHENIHEMDFEKLIQEAVRKEEYRQGTRLILLYSLKMLADKNLIHWEAGKTNHDYVNELSAGELKIGLNELSFYFDYAWYGNFSINHETFRKVENTFSNWRTKMKES